MKRSHITRLSVPRALLMAGALVLTAAAMSYTPVAAQGPASPTAAMVRGTGVLTGTVTADKGEIKALRVKARDTVRRVAYTVFTVQGRYSIYNLPPGSYEVQVVEGAFTSPVEKVQLAAGATGTANIALTQKPGAGTQSVDIVGSRFGAGRELPNAELVEYDELYPPGPARDILEDRCIGCHGIAGWHRRRGKTEAQWKASVDRMLDGTSPDGLSHVAPGEVTDAQRVILAKYFFDNFGPTSKVRELKLDTLVRNEERLSKAVYTTYELPEMDLTVARARGLNRGLHDVIPGNSPETRGTVWLSGFGSSSVIQFDPSNPDPKTRIKEWDITDPSVGNVAVHSVVESKGYVYWSELEGDHMGRLEIKTGKIERYPTTPGGGGHTITADSKGNVWLTEIRAGKAIGSADALKSKKIVYGKIWRFDPTLKTIIPYQVEPIGANWYGIVADKQDRVWAAGVGRRALAMFDPKTQQWTTYVPPMIPRRLTLDSKGNVWLNEFGGGGETMFDPVTKKFTRYTQPLKNTSPYEGWADSKDNIWLGETAYNSLAKLDTRTKEWTYFPLPVLGGGIVKMANDANDTMWFTLGGLTGFSELGNVPRGSAPSRTAR